MTPLNDPFCDLHYNDPVGHDESKCSVCQLSMGNIQCNGCGCWQDPAKMTQVEQMDDYKFCPECAEENPHFCANEILHGDECCDGVVFGSQKHCNKCLGEWIKSTRIETVQMMHEQIERRSA